MLKGFPHYHSVHNHYTHKITIFKLFRSLQLQFSGPTGINFRYSYSFVGLTGIFLYRYSSVQLHKKWSMELFSENYSYSYIKKVFELKCNDFEKNGKKKENTNISSLINEEALFPSLVTKETLLLALH